MEKVYTSSGYSNQLLSQMSELLRENKYCDAILNIQDERLKLHKLVLMAACPNILRCLAHTEENNIFEFYLPDDIEKLAVRQIVNYLYIGSIHLNIANVYGIEKLAKQLRLCALSQFCHDFISLLELETNGQSLLLPGINQQIIPKQETTEVEKVEDPKSEDARSKSTTAMLTEISTSFLPQLTDGFEQLPIASSSIKTELDADMNPTLEETVCVNREKSNVIDPLDKILQVSVSGNSKTSAVVTSVCKSWDSVSLDPHISNDSLESPSVSHQTCTMGTQDQQFSSNQDQTNTSLTPVLGMTACNPSISRSLGGEIDDMDLIMTAEDEDFEDSGDEWVPHGDDSSDLDDCHESSPNRSTEPKRKMATKGPKLQRSKKDTPMTAKKKKFGGDKMNQGDTKNGSDSDGKPRHVSRYGRTLEPSISYGAAISSLKNDGLEDGRMQEEGSSERSKLLTDVHEISEDNTSKTNAMETPLASVQLESMLHKIKVAEYAETFGLDSAAAHFNGSQDSIRDWMLLKNYFKKKTKIAKKKSTSQVTLQNCIKIGEHTDLEDKVINWLLENKYILSATDDLSTIGNKTLEFVKEIGKPELKIGIPWIKQILERYVSVTKNDETGEICTEEFRLKVTDYAREHGVKAASNLYGLDVNTVGWWTRKYKAKVIWKTDGVLNPNTKSQTRKRYTVNFKIEAVKCAEKLGNRAAARIYGVSETNVRLWRKHKEQLSHSKGHVLKLKPSVSPRQYSLLESLVKHWIISERRKITGAEIRAKALSFAEQANSRGFKGSHKWFYQFIKCHNLQQYVKLECSKEENFEFEKRKEVARSLERDNHGRFKSKPGEGFLSHKFKLEVVRFAETNGNDEAVKKYGISQTVICDWRLQKSYLSQRISAQKERDKESAIHFLN